MNVFAGSTNVSTYFSLRLAASGLEATGLDVTTFDLQYTRSGATPAAKVDATALASAGAAHTDNAAIEVDATDQPGLYRVDWPDAAFAAGVREVILTVKVATCYVEHLRAAIDTNVPQTGDSYLRIGSNGASLTALAPASTALSTVRWTNARAAYLDHLASLIGNASPFLSTVFKAGVHPTQIATTLNGSTQDFNNSPTMECFAIQQVGDVEDEGTLDGLIQESANGSDWFDISGATFTQVDGDNDIQQITFTRTMRYLRWRAIVTGGSVVFTLSVTLGDVPVIASLAGTIADRLPAALVDGRMSSSVGAMAANVLTAAAVDASAATSLATALLDLANGVESGVTLRQALRLIAAALAGARSNVGTVSEAYAAVGAPGTPRIVGNLDAAGNGTPTVTP